MGLDYSVEVCCAAAVNFDTVGIKYFVKFMRGWEEFFNEFEESFGNVG